MLVDPAQMCSRCSAEPVQTGRSEDRLRATGVGKARIALDQAVQDEPVDQARDAALAEDHAVRQLAHPDPPIGRVRDRQQRVVLGERQVVLGAQLVVEPAGDPRMRLQERTPRLEPRVLRGKRSDVGSLNDGHGIDATPSARGDDWLTTQRYPNMLARSNNRLRRQAR